jgi:hypothetical protein
MVHKGKENNRHITRKTTNGESYIPVFRITRFDGDHFHVDIMIMVILSRNILKVDPSGCLFRDILGRNHRTHPAIVVIGLTMFPLEFRQPGLRVWHLHMPSNRPGAAECQLYPLPPSRGSIPRKSRDARALSASLPTSISPACSA